MDGYLHEAILQLLTQITYFIIPSGIRNVLQGCVSGKKFVWSLLFYTTLPLDFKAKHPV